MPTATMPPPNINRIASVAGIERYEVRTLIKEHAIPHWRSGNSVVVKPEGLRILVEILSRFPGVDPSFADHL